MTPKKRRVDDAHDAEGLRDGTADLGDLLSHPFGFSPRAAPHRSRSRDIVKELPVSLADVFNGAGKKITSTRKVPCQACNATGCKLGFTPQPCD